VYEPLAKVLGQAIDIWEIPLPPEQWDKPITTTKKPSNTWGIPFPSQKWSKRPDPHWIDIRRFMK
jgi:hypothetical protein